MAKDRAAPFSRKHRRYWLPVTGGMVVIGAINIGLGVCSYKRAGDHEPIHVQPYVYVDAAVAPGELGIAQIPADVMRAFSTRYPQIIPASARVDGGTVIVKFPAGAAHQTATFRPNGTFISEQ